MLNLPEIPKIQPIGFDISGVTYSTLSKTWVLQRKYEWRLFMPHFINGVYGHLIAPMCQDVRFGNYSIASLSTMQYGAFQRFYAGLQTITNVGLTFVMPIDNSVIDYFDGWYHQMISKDGFYAPKSNYAKTIYVHFFDRSGVESVRFELHGAFVSQRPVFDPSYSANDLQRVSFNLSVDRIETRSLIGQVRSAAMGLADDVLTKTVGALGSSGGLLGSATSTAAGNVLW